MMEENPSERPEMELDLEPDQGYDEVGTSTYWCSIIGKGKKVVWRNFDNTTTNLGIKREIIHTQVRENEEGKI